MSPGTLEQLAKTNFTTTEELVQHVFYAAQRMTWYAGFAKHRDSLIKVLCKEARSDEKLDSTQYPLTAVAGVTPFEAYAGRSCRYTLTFVKSCSSALLKLYETGIQNIVGWESNNPDPNFRPSPQQIQALVAQRLKDHSAAMVARPDITPLPKCDLNVAVPEYQATVQAAHTEYLAKMQALEAEWKHLAEHYTMWEPKLDGGKLVYDELLTFHFRLELDAMVIPTIQVQKIDLLQNYVDRKANSILHENTNRDMGEAQPPRPGSAAPAAGADMAALRQDLASLGQAVMTLHQTQAQHHSLLQHTVVQNLPHLAPVAQVDPAAHPQRPTDHPRVNAQDPEPQGNIGNHSNDHNVGLPSDTAQDRHPDPQVTPQSNTSLSGHQNAAGNASAPAASRSTPMSQRERLAATRAQRNARTTYRPRHGGDRPMSNASFPPRYTGTLDFVEQAHAASTPLQSCAISLRD